jgi:DNA repair exonuclease SbcCD nuclease subunit
VRLAIINDVHLADTPPRWRTDSYNDDLFAKLEWVRDDARSRGVDAFAICGDIFHNPQPTRVSHGLVNRMIGWVNSCERSVLLVPGNHDLPAGSITAIARTPLWSLGQQRGCHLLFGGDSVVIDGVSIAGYEWNYDQQKIVDAINEDRWETQRVHDIILTHAAIAAEQNPFYETINPHDIEGCARVVCFGHLHPPEQLYSVGATHFVNVGALSRGSISKNDLERIPQYGLIELIKPGYVINITMIPIAAAKSAASIFRLEQRDAIVEHDEAIATFVSDLRDTVLKAVDTETLVRAASEKTSDPAVRALLAQILREV